MPIPPLHFGVLAPVNHFFPGKVSVFSFALSISGSIRTSLKPHC